MRDKTFVVQISKLSPGLNNLSFKVSDSFFDQFPFSTIKKTDLLVSLDFEKQEHLHVLSFHIQGWVESECDICLETIQVPLDAKYQLLVKQTEEKPLIQDDVDLIVIGFQDNELDLSTQIYDYVYVSMPIRKVCEMVGKTCNPLMADRLKKENSGIDEDDRWAELKKLKDNN